MEKAAVGIICVSILGVILAINVSTLSKLLLTMMTIGMLGPMIFEDDVNQAQPARHAPPALPAPPAPPTRPALPASLAPPTRPALPALPASLAPFALPASLAPFAPPASLAPFAPPALLTAPVQQSQSMAARQAASLIPSPVQHNVHVHATDALARRKAVKLRKAEQGGVRANKAYTTTTTIAGAWFLLSASAILFR